MKRLRWIWTLPIIMMVVFVAIFFSLNRQPSTMEKGDNLVVEVTPPEIETTPSDRTLSNWEDRRPTTSIHAAPDTSSDATEPTYVLVPAVPRLETYASLIEGVDSLTAAKRLKREGAIDYARQYARKAVAEHPESFEELLFLAQLLPPNEIEREATFRRLVEINSTTVEVLYGLGTTIYMEQPAEAILYLNAVIAEDPLHGSAYNALGLSYERLGMYDEALAAFKKSCKLPPPGVDIRKWVPEVALIHIRAIEAGNPIFKPIQQKLQEKLPEVPALEETLRQELPRAESSVAPSPTQRSANETVSDSD